MAQPYSLDGRQFGRLTVIRKVSRWVCRCECGRLVEVQTDKLMSGSTKSCGCFRKFAKGHTLKLIHGEARSVTPEYRAWAGMKNRCSNRASNRQREQYFDRGIRVCDRWRDSFQAFLEDVGRRPAPGFSIDRINNDGNYEPENVRWADSKTQIHNRRPRSQWKFKARRSA